MACFTGKKSLKDVCVCVSEGVVMVSQQGSGGMRTEKLKTEKMEGSGRTGLW